MGSSETRGSRSDRVVLGLERHLMRRVFRLTNIPKPYRSYGARTFLAFPNYKDAAPTELPSPRFNLRSNGLLQARPTNSNDRYTSDGQFRAAYNEIGLFRHRQ